MKKLLYICLLATIIFTLTGCGTYKYSNNDEIIESEELDCYKDETEIEKGTSPEEITTEWSNQYIENYKVISKQTMDFVFQYMADWDTMFLSDALCLLESKRQEDIEACIAIVTLTNVADESYVLEFGRETQVNLKIEQILEHNGVGASFDECVEIIENDSVLWHLCEDGTYEIDIHPKNVPFAEIGSKYVAYITYNQEGTTEAIALSQAFIGDGIYIDTVAIGNFQHSYMSAQTLWYFDINPSYYLEYWNNHPEDVEMFKSQGKDVFDKEWLRME